MCVLCVLDGVRRVLHLHLQHAVHLGPGGDAGCPGAGRETEYGRKVPLPLLSRHPPALVLATRLCPLCHPRPGNKSCPHWDHHG